MQFIAVGILPHAILLKTQCVYTVAPPSSSDSRLLTIVCTYAYVCLNSTEMKMYVNVEDIA